MQPTVICTALVLGMVFLNGRFAGEAGPQQPLFAPVSPFGGLYLEFRPLAGGWHPLARRLVFSGGAPVQDSLADAQGLSCVAWPDGALEVELAPEQLEEAFSLDGIPCRLLRGEDARLWLGAVEISLPDGARRPRMMRFSGCAALLGELSDGGSYLVSLTDRLDARTGELTAERIEVTGDGRISAMVSASDSVGHAQTEQWQIDPVGLHRIASESVWLSGAPRWPQTPEETLLAAAQAALAGLRGEMNGYMTPALAASAPLDAIAEGCDLALPMKYPHADPRPCIGLLRVENAHLARIRPLYGRAIRSPGQQGPWKLEWIGLQ